MSPVRKTNGFSLIEIIIFVSILSVALISLIASVNYSSVLLANARYKVIATRFSEELSEWLKYQRQYYGYTSINDQIPTNEVTYCFNTIILSDSWPTAGECAAADFSLDNYFKREVTLTKDPLIPDEIVVEINTSYRLLNFTKIVTINLKFNNYGL